MTQETLQLNIDSSILWAISEYEAKEIKEFEEIEEYLVIDNPINRIKEVKY